MGQNLYARYIVYLRAFVDNYFFPRTFWPFNFLFWFFGGDPEKGAIEAEKRKPYKVSFGRLARASRPEFLVFVFGLIAASVNGVTFPIFAILYAEIVTTFAKPDPHVPPSSLLPPSHKYRRSIICFFIYYLFFYIIIYFYFFILFLLLFYFTLLYCILFYLFYFFYTYHLSCSSVKLYNILKLL
jgi:hypothetical protein